MGTFNEPVLLNDERFLSAHIADLAAQSRRTGVPRFSRFLNEREAVVALNTARIEHAQPFFYGGYDCAARTVCGFFGDTYAAEMSDEEKRELFPIEAITFSFRACDKPTHRDFLGAVLNTGLDRSAVGDIMVGGGFAVVFCINAASGSISDISKVGRVGVKPEHGITRELPKAEFETLDRTVSSLRLDRVVAACANISGERSASLIRSGQVSADFSVCLNVSMILKENVVLSIRGVGRFRLSKIVGDTKKGRIRILIEKYI